jgi:hypothetical protein
MPPNGFMGSAQQTQATQALLRTVMGRVMGKTRRTATARTKTRKTKRAKSPRSMTAKTKKTKKTRTGSTVKRLVKGSQAAKNYMAKIRKLRGKKK